MRRRRIGAFEDNSDGDVIKKAVSKKNFKIGKEMKMPMRMTMWATHSNPKDDEPVPNSKSKKDLIELQSIGNNVGYYRNINVHQSLTGTFYRNKRRILLNNAKFLDLLNEAFHEEMNVANTRKTKSMDITATSSS